MNVKKKIPDGLSSGLQWARRVGLEQRENWKAGLPRSMRRWIIFYRWLLWPMKLSHSPPWTYTSIIFNMIYRRKKKSNTERVIETCFAWLPFQRRVLWFRIYSGHPRISLFSSLVTCKVWRRKKSCIRLKGHITRIVFGSVFNYRVNLIDELLVLKQAKGKQI